MTALLIPLPAKAFGPGTHVRESRAFAEILVEVAPEWADLVQSPMAMQYLALGSIAPDLREMTDKITFGHELDLAYHLLDSAETAEQSMFALGVLSHIASDGSADSFVIPALFSSRPLGMFNLTQGHDSAAGESEMLIDSLGDLVFGDWDQLIQVLYDFYLSVPLSSPAEQIIMWYCGEARQYLSLDVDCEAVWLDIADSLDEVSAILGDMERETARQFVADMLDLPLADLIDLISGGFAGSLLGDYGSPSFESVSETARLKASALVDREFWAQYEEMANLGPSFALAFYQKRPARVTWPTYDLPAIISGNIMSILSFLPEQYASNHGLIVDRVEWIGTGGQEVTVLNSSAIGGELWARIRFFGARPFKGTVGGYVIADQGGTPTTPPQRPTAPVGFHAVDVDIHPELYGAYARSELTIPVVVTGDLLSGRGLTIEMYLNNDERPFFTSDMRRIWSAGADDMTRPIYMDNFDTYDHWPASLGTSNNFMDLFATTIVYPDGPPVAGALVTVSAPDLHSVTVESSERGLATTFGWSVAPTAISAKADGFIDVAPISPTASGTRPIEVIRMHPDPKLVAPSCVNVGAEIGISWSPEVFHDQAETFFVTMARPDDQDNDVQINVGATGEATLTTPALKAGQTFDLAMSTRYNDGSTGPSGPTVAVEIAGGGYDLPPQLTLWEVPECVEIADFLPWFSGGDIVVTPSSTTSCRASFVTWTIGSRSNTIACDDSVCPPDGSFKFQIAPIVSADGDSLRIAFGDGDFTVELPEVPIEYPDIPICDENQDVQDDIASEQDVFDDLDTTHEDIEDINNSNMFPWGTDASGCSSGNGAGGQGGTFALFAIVLILAVVRRLRART